VIIALHHNFALRVYTGYTEVGYSPPIILWTLGNNYAIKNY